MFKPKNLRNLKGECELQAKAYNVPWMICGFSACQGIGAPQPIFCKARVITAWLADMATGLIEDEDYQTENLIMLAQCMCLDSL